MISSIPIQKSTRSARALLRPKTKQRYDTDYTARGNLNHTTEKTAAIGALGLILAKTMTQEEELEFLKE